MGFEGYWLDQAHDLVFAKAFLAQYLTLYGGAGHDAHSG